MSVRTVFGGVAIAKQPEEKQALCSERVRSEEKDKSSAHTHTHIHVQNFNDEWRTI